MLLILEIWLTVAAWRKGWKALALIPCGAVFVFGMMIGVACPNPDDAFVIGLVGDIITCVVLGIMAARGRNTAPAPVAQVEQYPASTEAEMHTVR